MREDERALRGVLDRLGVDGSAEVEPAAGGASGAAWFVRTASERYVLRVDGSPIRTDARLAAIDAARGAGLPAPALVRRSDEPGRIGLLLTYLEGVPVLDLLWRSADEAIAWASRMGALHRRLHAVVAPEAVISVDDEAGRPFHVGELRDEVPIGGSLLHFDWHPGNLLADEASGEISGIVDWDNARRGHPSLDLARTESMLTVEPFIGALEPASRRLVDQVRLAWADGYGPEAAAIPAAARRWAGRVMLEDLAHRYADHPERLDPARRWAEGVFS
ncbi:MAG TPA: aminoglycoside phosphotransferase family protein [Candidatus Limnocylindria bacterium]|nr:aminoglycoside phosphotransferase family protein [Candidatus Limnocylindria bacterium]